MQQIKFHKKYLLLLLLPLGAILLYGSASAPHLVESLYSRGLYNIFSLLLNAISGFLPFSLAEVGLAVIVLFSAWYILRTIVKLVKGPSGRGQILLNFLVNLLIAVSIAYFSYIILWGLNYSRLPFSHIASLDVQPSTADELYKVCESLIERTSTLRALIKEDSKGVICLEDGYSGAFKRAYRGYENASKIYPQLGDWRGNPKAVLLSEPMSYTSISGIFCPWTGEANVDVAMPPPLIPSTATHEMAHQRGFAREDEANYIAYLTCSLHPDPDFQYSGTLLALIHSMNALYGQDTDKFNQLRSRYSEAVRRDLISHNDYWKRHKGTVEKVSDSLNNAYLKANMQKDGVQSYGRMVDLLIAEYRKNH